MDPSDSANPRPGPDLALQLIAECDWIRSLARSMVRCEADAEDLAQDALVEALEARGDRAPRRVRSWLSTTLRRRVVDHHRHRSSGADALRQMGVEAAAAGTRPSIDSEERFALHEELARVLRGLPKVQRDLLLRRHVDQVPPRELAKELGLTSEQVRKRLLRALGEVREELAQTQRGEASWRSALLVLAAPAGGGLGAPAAATSLDVSPTSSGASSGTVLSNLLPLIAMSITKKLCAAAVLLAIGTVTWHLVTPGPLPLTGPQSIAMVGNSPEDLILPTEIPTSVANAGPERLAALATASEPVAITEPVPTLAQIRIVDETLAPVLDARGVWLGEGRAVHPFEADADARFSIPVGRKVRVFAKSGNRSALCVDVEPLSDGEVKEIQLPPRPVLSFRVTVDGEPPGERISFSYYESRIATAIESIRSPQVTELRRHRFPPKRPRVESSPEGIVRVELPECAENAGLTLQSGYAMKSITINGARTAPPKSFEFLRVPLNDPSVHVDLFRLPSLIGRFIWADTHEVFTGDMYFDREGLEGYSIGGSVSTTVASDGRFRLSLTPGRAAAEETWRLLAEREGGAQPSEVFTEWAARVTVTPIASGAQRKESSFDITKGVELIDVGDILVTRNRELKILVLGRSGEQWVPVEAAVAGSLGAVRTNSDGMSVLRISKSDSLVVFAPGFDLTRVAVPVAQTGSEDPFRIRLEPAPLLEVEVPRSLLDPTGRRSPQVKISYDSSPFGSWTRPSDGPIPMTHAIYKAHVGYFPTGLSKLQKRYLLLPVPSSGIVQVPCLRKGAAFDVALTDHQNEVYASQSVVFEGAKRLSEWPEGLEPAYVDLSLVDTSAGTPLSGRFGLVASSNGAPYAAFADGVAQAGPLAPGLYKLSVLYDVDDAPSEKRIFEDITLVPGVNEIGRDLAID